MILHFKIFRLITHEKLVIFVILRTGSGLVGLKEFVISVKGVI